MCGIAGIIAGDEQKVSVELLQQMTNAIAHRGPDGKGHWTNNSATVALGHRRLSIIDLSSNAAQPMHYNGGYTITYNGEIYNYIELRETLLQKGYTFQTQSDTEVILAAYDCWKENCLQYFDGMFALAIWDEKDKSLFAARDRFGEKPFYYAWQNEQLLFASEIKALWTGGVEKKRNDTFLLFYLSSGLLNNPNKPGETFYENIFSLPAASYLLYKPTEKVFTINRWWDLDKETRQNITEKEAIDKLYSFLSGTVTKRLRSDVEVGTSLSGGLDSSSILALICKQNKPVYKTFSAVFPGFEKDESKYIDEVVKKFPVQHFTLTPTADDLNKDIDSFLYYQEQPVQSASVYLQYKIYELAKQHGIKVVLDGQGADEVLGGYTKYLHWYLQELVAKGQFGLANSEKNILQSNYPMLQWSWKNYIAAFAPFVTVNRLQKKVFKAAAFHPHINPDFSYHSFNKEAVYKPAVHKLNDILYYDTMQNTLPELLHYADRNSMAHGVELRLPFLNDELVQFIFSLPSSFKIRDGFTKWVLRKAMQPQLPPAICWRKDKIGYEPPQQQWMQHSLIREKITAAREKLVKEEILLPSVLNTAIKTGAAHDADNYDWRYLSAMILF